MTEPEPKEKPEQEEKRIMRMMQIARGENPDAQQTINDFMRFDNPIERTNLPTTVTVLCVGQLDFSSNWLYPDGENNPFGIMAKSLSESFMARKGEKANQFVDIVRNQPDLSGIQTTAIGEQQRGIMDRIFRRGREE
jgi:hypothetical protein